MTHKSHPATQQKIDNLKRLAVSYTKCWKRNASGRIIVSKAEK